ncbi:mechanosensitive ion channel family protein [Mesonia aestuariivivens]|uniref:Mechanosensitive ion channel family protein n=1 Tax=Mesonia aestuariivivens TaxID=2796128 RepID=A0ABS6VZS5_9FLAO|nr:mechanosensitive ion channel family protein [Mesonia aestuariivivens]MBW2961087.1 mechanosensitive ion channel family protein [Mesonia aestuariivivens]
MEKNSTFNFSEAIGGIYDKLADWLDALILNLPNFILAVLVFIVFIVFAKYVGKILTRILLKRNIQHSVRDITVRILKLVIISFGFFIALGLLNLDKLLTSILAGAGVVGLAIGLALQGTLSNTVSGVILSFLPEIQIGDWVETNGFAGEVREVNLRNIVIIQSDNNHVVIPNTKIVEDAFKNFSRTKRSRVMLACGVGYESDLEKVEEITINAISAIFKQIGEEQIEFAYEEFGDSSINYVVRFWTDVNRQKDILFAKHKAILAIKKAYNEEDINIPFPIRTLDFGKNKFRSETIQIHQKEQ